MSRTRLLLVVLLFVGLLGVSKLTGLGEAFSAERVRAAVAGAGTLGVIVFVAAFVLGELVHVPGLIFVGVAVLVYGPLEGGVLAYGAAILSLSVSFLVVRGVGGKPLGAIERPWVVRLLARMDERPILTVALLRVVLIVSPPLNYALALTRIAFRDYVLGSALGLVAPIGVAAFVFDRVGAGVTAK